MIEFVGMTSPDNKAMTKALGSSRIFLNHIPILYSYYQNLSKILKSEIFALQSLHLSAIVNFSETEILGEFLVSSHCSRIHFLAEHSAFIIMDFCQAQESVSLLMRSGKDPQLNDIGDKILTLLSAAGFRSLFSKLNFKMVDGVKVL
jgi:hypothetical protein